jgi:acyl-CoA thioesterase I
MLARILFILAAYFAPGIACAATILVFGDSLSAGYGLPQTQGWVSLLEERLRAEKFPHRVVNASVSGETTTGGAARIAGALKTHRPDIVIVALGANDGLRGQDLRTMRRNLATMIDASRKAGAEVLLVGMRLPPNYGPAYTESFRQSFVELAREKKTPLVPFLLDGFAEDARYFQADRAHPTAQAQPLILETVWKGLKPLLKR